MSNQDKDQKQLKERLEDPLLKAQLRLAEIVLGTLFSIFFFGLLSFLGIKLFWQPNVGMESLAISDSGQQLADVIVYYPPKLSAEDQGELLITVRSIISEPITITMSLLYDPNYVFFEYDNLSVFLQNAVQLIPYGFYSCRLSFETTNAPITTPISIDMTFASQNGNVVSEIIEVPINSFAFLHEAPGVRLFLADLDLKLLTPFAGVLSSIVWSLIYIIFCKKMNDTLKEKPALGVDNGSGSIIPRLMSS